MRGIILAGGSGSRLYPTTQVTSKQLLPVFDKPLIYYPLSVLMLARIQDILVVSTSEDLHRFHDLLGDGSNWGVSFTYATQPEPEGVAHALVVGRDFVGDDSVGLVLGDNIFYGHGLQAILQEAKGRRGATIFGYYVKDPRAYGVADVDGDGNVLSLEEKPAEPRSNYAVTGLYFYDNDALEIAAGLQKSGRGEYEITDVNREYLRRGRLHMRILGRGFAWLDAGTHDALLQAGNFIRTIEERVGLKIACPEEIAFRNGWIDAADLERLAAPLERSGYGEYLRSVLRESGEATSSAEQL